MVSAMDLREQETFHWDPFLEPVFQLSKHEYIPEYCKCYAGYFGNGRLKERVRIYQKKKLQRRFFGDELLKALDKQRPKNLEDFL
jgi:hypothetical protein